MFHLLEVLSPSHKYFVLNPLLIDSFGFEWPKPNDRVAPTLVVSLTSAFFFLCLFYRSFSSSISSRNVGIFHRFFCTFYATLAFVVAGRRIK